MKEIILNTEQIILEAAEQVFLEKGFAGAKTTEIAKRAGVNHAMIHYYYRTKEDLFNIVFQQKIYMLASSFIITFESGSTFFEKVRSFIEAHYDFLVKNPTLFPFLLTEIISNETRRAMLVSKMRPKLESMLRRVSESLDKEFEKGTIRKIQAADFILNVVSLNLISILALPILELAGLNPKAFLEQRRESNVQFIMSALKV